MNFLNLCKKVDVLLGSQGVFTSVDTTNGFQQLIVEHVKNAWSNIQASRRHWDFYRSSEPMNTAADRYVYDVDWIFGMGSTNPVESWIVDRFIKDSDKSTLRYIPYDTWILEDHTTVAKEPRAFTVYPGSESSSDLLELDKADGLYSYTLHYFRKPQTLTDNTDVPICPSEHHDVIVYQALADLAAHLGNSDIHSTAAIKADQLYGNLLRSQNPAKTAKPRPFI